MTSQIYTYSCILRASAILMICLITIALGSCDKGFLDARSDKSLVVPTTLKDYQAILDNHLVMNTSSALITLGTDEYYLSSNSWKPQPAGFKDGYVWAKDMAATFSSDWGGSYQQVYYANLILDGLNTVEINDANKAERDNIKGSALFYRANAFYKLSQLFAKPYVSTTADSDLGIVLKLTADVREDYSRSTNEQTYNIIIGDLIEAVELLPLSGLYKTRPSKVAANALLARVFLSIRDYTNALKYADIAITMYNELLDYNTLNESSFSPFGLFNKEVIFHEEMAIINVLPPVGGAIDSNIYRSYEPDDLRKTILFSDFGGGFIYYKGSYSGQINHFTGLATDEVYLIRAECNARAENLLAAAADLNVLLEKRWKQGTYIPITPEDSHALLKTILSERKKELLFRGIRWTDLRRLNQEEDFQTTLTRKIDEQTFNLPPNDPRYVWLIPDSEIRLSGIEQNSR